jgi:hypothetical protein
MTDEHTGAPAETVELNGRGANEIEADTVAINQGGAGQVRAREITITQGGVAVARTTHLELGQGSGAFAVVANEATVESGASVVLLLAGRTSGDVKPLLDAPAALALGVGFAVALAVVRRIF